MLGEFSPRTTCDILSVTCHMSCVTCNLERKKARIRETKNLSTDADRRTDTIVSRLRDKKKINK